MILILMVEGGSTPGGREARMEPPIQTEYFLPPPSRSRSSLPQRGSTPSGSEAPSWLPSPPSSRCGSQSRSTTSVAPPSSTGSASKCFFIFVQRIHSFDISIDSHSNKHRCNNANILDLVPHKP